MIEILQISLIGFLFSALTQEEHSLFTWYGNLIGKLKWYFCKPLGGCYRCFVGQICLWYLILYKHENMFMVLFLTSFGIIVSMVYNKIYCYLR